MDMELDEPPTLKLDMTKSPYTDYYSSQDDNTSLIEAAKSGNLARVIFLVEKKHSSPTELNKTGNSALHYAASAGHVDVVQYFIEEQGCSHSLQGTLKQTPLHIAALYGKTNVTKYLVGVQSVDPCQQDEYQRTAIHYACISGSLSTLKYLVEEVQKYMDVKVFIHDQTKLGYSALHLAARYGQNCVIRYLIQRLNCDTNVKGMHGKTPLHEASKYGCTNSIKCFISEFRCNPTVLDSKGRTPLHLAAKRGHIDVVKKIASDMACIMKIDNSGHSPVTLACANGQAPVVELFDNYFFSKIAVLGKVLQVKEYLEHRCRYPFNTDSVLKKALFMAAKLGHMEVVHFLIEEQKCSACWLNDNMLHPFQLASAEGHQNVAMYLYAKMEPALSRTSMHNIPLTVAEEKKELEDVKYLIAERMYNPSNNFDSEVTTMLNNASGRGNLTVLKYLIETLKLDPAKRNEYGYTPLICASQDGRLRIVKYLIDEHNCDPLCPDVFGQNALHHSVCSGHLETLRFLMKERCDLEQKLRSDLLNLAAERKHLHILKYLIEECKFDPQEKFYLPKRQLESPQFGIHMKKSMKEFLLSTPSMPSYTTLLHTAAKNGNVEMLKYLIEEQKCPTKFPCKAKGETTPLHIAACESQIHTLRYLIDKEKCDPNCVDFDLNTPLHLAAAHGKIEAVRYLIEECLCKPFARNKQRNTPISFAEKTGRLDIVKYFIQRFGYSPCCHDAYNTVFWGQLEVLKYLVSVKNTKMPKRLSQLQSALFFAIIRGNLCLVQYLVEEHNCDINDVNGLGQNALIFAAYPGNLDMVKYIISRKRCNIHRIDNDGRSSLWFVVKHGDIDILKFLLDEEDCNPSVPITRSGETMLHIAAQFGHVSLVAFLIKQKKANPYCTQKDHKTPLHFAVLYDKLDVVKYLIEKQGCLPSKGGGKCAAFTLLQYALFLRYQKMAEYLISMKVYD